MTDNDKTWVTKSEIASHIGKSEKTIERLLKVHPQLNELRVKRDRSWYYPLEIVQKYLSEYFPPVSTTTSVIETEVIETEDVQEDPVTKSEETENEVQKLRDVIERRNSFLRWVLVGNFFDGPGIKGSFQWFANPTNSESSNFMKVLGEIGVDVNDIIDKHFIFIEEQARMPYFTAYHFSSSQLVALSQTSLTADMATSNAALRSPAIIASAMPWNVSDPNR